MSQNQLEHVVYDTVRYFDIFDLPVTATQVWQCLVLDQGDGAHWDDSSYVRMRWAGHQHYSLLDVQSTLRESEWLKARLGTKWGYYFLSGREALVEKRLERHALAQDKWKITRRVSRWLSMVPFVRGLAGSGSLALDNTKSGSDLDLLVVVKQGRIWTARLGLLIVSQLLGRRRKHWDKRAPDMVCLNHYVASGHLGVPADIHNVYTAVMYSLLVPVFNRGVVDKFKEENGAWIREHVMSPDVLGVGHLYEVKMWQWMDGVKRLLEGFLLEPIGNAIERMSEKIQRSLIEKHHDYGRAGRVVVSDQELAFHPDTKVPAILRRFSGDPGQRELL